MLTSAENQHIKDSFLRVHHCRRPPEWLHADPLRIFQDPRRAISPSLIAEPRVPVSSCQKNFLRNASLTAQAARRLSREDNCRSAYVDRSRAHRTQTDYSRHVLSHSHAPVTRSPAAAQYYRCRVERYTSRENPPLSGPLHFRPNPLSVGSVERSSASALGRPFTKRHGALHTSPKGYRKLCEFSQ